ncbi:hypothetical protein DW082_13040 [Alistipes sp. AF48-12]|nr:hypothetical protein DW082_13040 [Alistipes sp. AF48-12]
MIAHLPRLPRTGRRGSKDTKEGQKKQCFLSLSKAENNIGFRNDSWPLRFDMPRFTDDGTAFSGIAGSSAVFAFRSKPIACEPMLNRSPDGTVRKSKVWNLS